VQVQTGSAPVQFTALGLRQSRPEQQAAVAEHAWPIPGQLVCWQVPLVLPAGMLQPRPAQQSEVATQLPFNG
jgi:hypothetical protein